MGHIGSHLACYASVWFTRFGLLVALCSQSIRIVGLLKHLCITHLASIYLQFKRSPKSLDTSHFTWSCAYPELTGYPQTLRGPAQQVLSYIFGCKEARAT
jgi:hypothetical protein